MFLRVFNSLTKIYKKVVNRSKVEIRGFGDRNGR